MVLVYSQIEEIRSSDRCERQSYYEILGRDSGVFSNLFVYYVVAYRAPCLERILVAITA